MILIYLILNIGIIYFLSSNNIIGSFAIFLLPFIVIFLYFIFKNPRIGFITSLFCNYFVLGISRYVPGPLGLLVDGTLALTFIALLFSQFNHKVNWEIAAKDYTAWVIAWAVMIVLQLFNPEAVSREAWFYAMRGYAVYSLFSVILVYTVFNRPKDLDLFITLLAWFTILAVIKALIQKYSGLDQWENKWLMLPGNRRTHLLFGKLRIFSFFPDAGTFGSAMGYSGVLFTILGIHEKSKINKRFYFIVGLLALFAMLISGTRSSIAVPLTGFSIYAILTKKFKIMFTGGFIVFSLFFILKYTYIGQGNYDIRRMRSGFSEENPSMQLRNENRRIFADYLKTRPFGGGIGSAGNWGLRFSPGTILAETATDGWYVQIWAETGIVGILFYLMMMLYMAFKSSYLIMFNIRDELYRFKAIGLTSGLFGLMVTCYTSASLGQMPNTVIAFVSISLISLIPEWEKEKLT